MNTHQKLQSNLNDIESKNNEMSNNLNDIESGNKISEEFNFKTKQNNYCNKITLILFLTIFTLPIPFFDLYYGYNDNTCVNEKAGKLSINLKDYLLVYGWVEICFIGIIIFNLFLNNLNCFKYFNCLTNLIEIFIMIWNIIGSIIFWSLIDNNKCSKTVYNYVFITLILKLIGLVLGRCQSGDKNNDNK